MSLDLEIVGAVRDLRPDDDSPAAKPRELTRLRDSHHQVARLIAAGLRTEEVSRITGYSISRLSWLQQQDPAFRELVEFYRQDRRDEIANVEARLLGVALDAVQTFHERMLDEPESISPATVLEAAKVLLDRAGYAPVTKSVNKNLNLNIGAKFDAAKEKVA
jgi:DNA-binding CsgD family transcriptional regulator